MYTIKNTKNGVAVLKDKIIIQIYSKSTVAEIRALVDYWNSNNVQPEITTFGY